MKKLTFYLIVICALLLFTIFSTAAGSLGFTLNSFLTSNAPQAESIKKTSPDEEPDPRVTALADQLTGGLTDDYHKLIAIYDWVTNNITYDLDKAANLSAYGAGAVFALENGSGVCHDYAELTRQLLQAAGIEAYYIRGEVTVGEGELELHAWNEAVVGHDIYALDTTWGAGFLLEEKKTFIHKPRRLYLTTPGELSRLHSDPQYKQEREEEYLYHKNRSEPVSYLPEEEMAMLDRYNQYRLANNLESFSFETRLLDLAREYAATTAEAVCAEEQVDLELLGSRLSEEAPALRARSAGMHVLVKWLYPLLENENSWEEVFREQSASLDDQRWQAATVGVVRKGDLVVFLTIFLEYQ